MAKQRGPPSATTTTSTVERFLTVETTRYWNPDDNNYPQQQEVAAVLTTTYVPYIQVPQLVVRIRARLGASFSCKDLGVERAKGLPQHTWYYYCYYYCSSTTAVRDKQYSITVRIPR